MKKYLAEIDGQQLAWYTAGSGKPLIILHGWGSHSKIMQPIAENLQRNRTVFLLDFPGFGESPEPSQPLNVQQYAEITERWINSVLPDENFDLFVHSFGARVAIKLLACQPISDRVEKVIFTGAAGLKPKRKASYYIKKYTAKVLKAPFWLLPANLREKGLIRLRDTSLWKKLGSSDYQQLSGIMRETFVKTVTEYLDADVANIQHEILLIWGKDDNATPLDQGIRMERTLPNSALVTIENAGHYAFLDQPSKFAAIARAYLDAG